jgi:hypothetical protein
MRTKSTAKSPNLMGHPHAKDPNTSEFLSKYDGTSARRAFHLEHHVLGSKTDASIASIALGPMAKPQLEN